MIRRNLCALALFATCASIASAQIGVIKTYAGNDSGSYPGNGGPATSAIITNPFGLAVDASGNLYIAASGNSVIRQVNATTGIITTVAGGGTGGDGGLATAAQLSNPCDVKLDSAGNMYISETCVVAEQGGGGGGSGSGGIARIRRVDATTGIITTIAGTTSSGFAGDGGPATSALLSLPTGLGIDSAGNIFIADSGNNRIRRIDAISGVITTAAGNGAAFFAGDGGPATSASLNGPTGVVIDANGNLFIADTGNNRVRRVDAISGNITTVAGTSATGFNGDGIAATTASLNEPASLTFNSSGNLVFTDLGNFRVRMIDNAGLIWTLAGDGSRADSGDSGQATLAALNGPVGVALSPSGPLFISEIFGDHIRQVALPSAIAATALTVSSTGTTLPPFTPITLTGTLASTNGSPYNATSGMIFYDGSTMLGSGPVSNGAAQITVSSLNTGTHSITAIYFGDSNYGGSYSPVFTLTIAVSAPTISSFWASPNPATANQPVTLGANVTPSSTTGAVNFYNGTTLLGSATLSGGTATLNTATFPAGTYSLTAQFGTSTSQTVTLTVKANASVAVTSSVNPSNPNQPVNFTATVTPSTATGTVQFSDGSTVLGTATVTSGVATFSTSTLASGTHSITAVYNGDANDTSAGSTPLTQTVKTSPSVVVASSVNPSSPNQSVTFTAAVTPSTATGTMQFSDGATVLGTATISSGVATFATSTLAAGQHSITAAYNGDTNNTSATSPAITQTVLAATSVALASSQNPAYSNTQVNFTASVSPSTATGTIQFLDGATVLGSAPVSGGSATLSISTLNQGTHSISAAYGGDANNASSTSAVLVQSMKSSAGMTTGASPIPPVFGQTVTFTANVNSAATGTVQFVDGPTVLATVAVSSGTASYATSTLAQGSHTISFNYSGDANYMSQSASFTFNVLSTTTTSLASSVNPSTTGQSVTFTATVAPAASTGTVQFYSGSTSLGTVTLNSGTATYSTSSLSQGSQTIVATYSGDSTHAPSSASLSQSVKSSAGLTTGVSPSPAITGQTVTLTANVNAAATGTVTFTDGGTTLSTVTVSSGHAAYSTASLAQGSHSLGFSYSGDANYLPASAGFTETVLAATSVALSSSANPSTTGQSVTFTASVTPSAATGTMQFLDSGSVIGTATLSSGTATFTTTSLAQGSHSITASYGGNSTDAASSSSVLTQVVNAASAPNAPSNLAATSAGASQINLTWTASSTSGVAYDVYASTTSGFTPSASNRLASGVSTTSYSATGLTGSTTYYFRVSATKSGVESTDSNQASAATSGGTSCHVVYTVSSQWGNGFNGAFSIQNTGSTTMTSWTLTWAWAGNQEMTQSWNANYKQTGANVTLTNMSYNNSIAPGATLTGMGFGASYSGTNTSPTTFYVNGTLCH